MWFRVELHKDGSVASCKQVAGSFESSRHVRYIEADSAKSATALAAKWWRIKQQNAIINKEVYERKKAEGICVMCRKAPAREGKVRCTKCALHAGKEVMRVREEKKTGTFVDNRTDKSRTDAEKYADHLKSKRGLWARRWPRVELQLLELIKAEFMVRPQSFAAWLEEQIASRKQALEPDHPVVTAAE